MVFGNMGETSATGVAFTRNPSTGEKELYGEFLVNAQGEDVVAGIRTPQNITEAARKAAGSDRPSLETLMPEVFRQFVATTELLEKHYRDMQDLEFTIERGKLWMLQTRNGKRTGEGGAARRGRHGQRRPDLARGGDRAASSRPRSTSCCIRRSTRRRSRRRIATGLPASPGAASGEIVFSADEAEALQPGGAQDRSWCASRPRPRTSTACTPPKAS